MLDRLIIEVSDLAEALLEQNRALIKVIDYQSVTLEQLISELPDDDPDKSTMRDSLERTRLNILSLKVRNGIVERG